VLKIAILGSRGYPYVYSGYETFVKEVAERLVKQGVAVTVYCHKNLFKTRPEKVNDIELVYIPTIQKKTLAQFIHTIQSMFHACLRNYDIILVVNSANGPFGLISKIFRKKTAINVDGLEWLRPKWKGLGAKYFHFASKLSTILYDAVITDSFEMEKIYKKEFNASSTVIAYGANERFSKNPELIEKWNLTKHGFYLIVGRLIPDNNSDLIVREFIKSSSKRKLVIVGDVPYNDDYALKIKQTVDNRVIFTGYITDQNELAELYHCCFAYFHGHEFGGTNPTMLHALAYGCAVLALDTVFTKEMLENDKYGMFFTKKENNLKGLLEKIEYEETLLDSYRKKSRERIRENYTWEKITNEYIALFQKMNT
jgi:glycosyltransferase involved in cell wall biosynthesis